MNSTRSEILSMIDTDTPNEECRSIFRPLSLNTLDRSKSPVFSVPPRSLFDIEASQDDQSQDGEQSVSDTLLGDVFSKQQTMVLEEDDKCLDYQIVFQTVDSHEIENQDTFLIDDELSVNSGLTQDDEFMGLALPNDATGIVDDSYFYDTTLLLTRATAFEETEEIRDGPCEDDDAVHFSDVRTMPSIDVGTASSSTLYHSVDYEADNILGSYPITPPPLEYGLPLDPPSFRGRRENRRVIDFPLLTDPGADLLFMPKLSVDRANTSQPPLPATNLIKHTRFAETLEVSRPIETRFHENTQAPEQRDSGVRNDVTRGILKSKQNRICTQPQNTIWKKSSVETGVEKMVEFLEALAPTCSSQSKRGGGVLKPWHSSLSMASYHGGRRAYGGSSSDAARRHYYATTMSSIFRG